MTWHSLFNTRRFEHHNKTLAIKAASGAVRPASAITGLGEKAGWQAQQQQQYSKRAVGSQQQKTLSRRPHSAGPGSSSRGPRDIFPVDLQLVSSVCLPLLLAQAYASSCRPCPAVCSRVDVGPDTFLCCVQPPRFRKHGHEEPSHYSQLQRFDNLGMLETKFQGSFR
jgi:hypothetical protein